MSHNISAPVHNHNLSALDHDHNAEIYRKHELMKAAARFDNKGKTGTHAFGKTSRHVKQNPIENDGHEV